jgi:Mrp family chromosome partitioning ATPase/capsular polysaccharide biosynthesis protein
MKRETGAGMSTTVFMKQARSNFILIVAIALISAIGAYLYSDRQVPMYAASAQLLYQPQVDVTNPQSYIDPNAQQLQVQGAATMLTAPVIAARVEAAVGNSPAFADTSVSAYAIAPSQSSGTSYSTGVAVTGDSLNPKWAARMANAYAAAFVAWRVQRQQAAFSSAEAAISAQLKQFTTVVERSSSNYENLQQSLDDLQIQAATATGDFVVAVPAYTPSAPYAPKPRHSAIMGLAAGFLVGLGVALLRARLDTRLHSHREVGDLLNLPIVGRIPTIKSSALTNGPLVVLGNDDPYAAEALRVFATNLEYVSLGDEHRVIMFVSAMPGEGKSLVIANLAVSLALAGRHVVLVDADLRRPQVHATFHVPNVIGVSSVIASQATVDEAIQCFEPVVAWVKLRQEAGSPLAMPVSNLEDSLRFPATAATRVLTPHKMRSTEPDNTPPKLWLLPAGPPPPNPGEMIASRRFGALIERLKAMPFDYVLIDSPALLSVGDASAVAAAADGCVVVVNLKWMNRKLVEELKETLDPLPLVKLGAVTTLDEVDRGGYHRRYGYVQT